MFRRGVGYLAPLLLLLTALPAWAEDLTFVYLGLEDDPRYLETHADARFLLEPTGRPLDGAEVALRELRFVGQAIGVEFGLEEVLVEDPADLESAVTKQLAAGRHYFLADLPGSELAALAAATREQDLLLLNVSAQEDNLRAADCQAHLLHLPPSHAMQTDALVQYLVSRKWPRMLVLQGPLEADAQLVAALERSARRYGGEIVEIRDFVLSNDPRQREENNVALLTGNADYDVVFVADTDGEFGRDVPYHTLRPTLVVGTAGLGAAAWHWSWERHGAPQLNNRFVKQAERQMTGYDWGAWMAVKAVAEAVLRTESTDLATVSEYLLGEEIILDGFKGNRLNFRPWNRQLRQPVLLITSNWVVDRAPIRGFLHQSNNMDTLGVDAPESQCEF